MRAFMSVLLIFQALYLPSFHCSFRELLQPGELVHTESTSLPAQAEGASKSAQELSDSNHRVPGIIGSHGDLSRGHEATFDTCSADVPLGQPHALPPLPARKPATGSPGLTLEDNGKNAPAGVKESWEPVEPQVTVPKKSKFAGFIRYSKSIPARLKAIGNAFKSLFRYILQRRPSDIQVQNFHTARDLIARSLVTNQRLKLGSDEAFNMENLAKDLAQRFPLLPPLMDRANGESVYQEYLKTAERYQLANYPTSEIRMTPRSKYAASELTDGSEMLNEVSKSFEQLNDPQTIEHFRVQLEEAVDRISKVNKWKLPTGTGDIGQYFPSISIHEKSENSISPMRFARAQAGQSKKEVSTDPGVLDLELESHNLQPNLEDKEELFRYQMIEGFQNVLRDIRPQLYEDLYKNARTEIADFLTKSSLSEAKGDSIFTIAAEGDVAWRESAFARFYQIPMSPSEAFEKLKQGPKETEIIRYAINKHAETLVFLSPAELEVLRGASTRKIFQGLLNSIKKNMKARGVNNMQPKLAALADFEKDVRKSYGRVNVPLAQELFNKGVIESEFRNELMPEAGMSKRRFVQTLGTKEEFTKKLMDRFETQIGEQLKETPSNEILALSSRHVARSSLYQLDQDAKSLYLGPDALQKSKPFQFDQALEVYDPQVNKLIQEPIDPKTLARAHVDTVLARPYKPRSVEDVEWYNSLRYSLERRMVNMEDYFDHHLPKMSDYFEQISRNRQQTVRSH
ncbi:hypothetical protein Pst134EA_024210 [Puccinia striiformis f. sp. tritici]|uniref:Uncharacterized protein n=2 Tax=Puccinia striiformis TaxID=27350 RepID=A0A0L0VYC7_9BASI|nr:hypothetical protein Pst134EA_024210 [Puccinia striiformis f. sp. tritici]KAH9453333.1 hypothetical protein Pst134EA_024210 [Puccinia striiformis f. sp. tritici]KNF03995.1 hypothetical protein PSTG_02704 [Puccinia striiformis f. sp. tritici PST-78]POW15918.1 hypothetical protein PSTT_01803 [Puccinia striiformis]